MPVKLSDELVETARKEAAESERSLTAQIEHWAKLGRSVETVLRHEHASTLKHARGSLRAAFPDASTREAVLAVLRQLAVRVDRSELARGLKRGRIVYQADPSGAGRIERIAADGTRTAGRMEGRRFVAARPARRHAIDE